MRQHEAGYYLGLAQRIVWSSVWFSALVYFVELERYWDHGYLTGLVGPVGVLVAVVAMALPWCVQGNPPTWFTHASAAALAAATFFGGWMHITALKLSPSDASAFTDYAVKMWVNGIDPYGASMSPANATLGNPAAMWTYTLSGGHVSNFSYPGGLIVFEAPLRLLGVTHFTGSWFNLGAWIVACLAAYVMLPRPLKAFALLAMALAGTTAIGGTSTDAAWMPFLLVGVFQWDRFGDRSRPWYWRYAGPVALGLACSFKLTPCFVVPFLLIGVFIETRQDAPRPYDAVLKYLAALVGSFLVVNLPFIVVDPAAWLRGAILPVNSPLVPGGGGLVTFALHGDVPGVRTFPLSLAGLVALVVAAVAYALWYDRLKSVAVFLVPVIFYVPVRSEANYLESFLLVGIVAGATIQPSTRRIGAVLTRRARAGLVAVPGAAAVVLVAYSFFVPVLTSSVVGISTQGRLWTGLTLRITNHSGRDVASHVQVLLTINRIPGFWVSPTGTTVDVPAHQTLQVRLTPPTAMAVPGPRQVWVAEVMTDSPSFVGVTAPVYGSRTTTLTSSSS